MSVMRSPVPGPFMEGMEPEREPVKFDISLSGAPEEVTQLMNNIQEVAEMFLYHWKTFPMVLPPPLGSIIGSQQMRQSSDQLSYSGPHGTPDGVATGYQSLARKHHRVTNVRDLFIAPSFDELDAVAMDCKGEPRRLNSKHLGSVQERGLDKDKYGKPKKLTYDQLENVARVGEFQVDSVNFPGQVHRWRLSELLQKGSERTRDTLLNDLALAARFIIVTAKGRICSHYFSVLQAMKSLLVGILRLLDILVGVPSLLAQNLDGKLREERSRYLAAELVCRPELEEKLERLCGFIQKQLKRATTEKFDCDREIGGANVPIPYLFQTPKGFELDMRLFSRDTMKKAMQPLIHILERETRGWFLHFRERLITELRAQKLSDEQIEREVNDAVMREYLNRVFNSILTHPDLLALGEAIPQLLVQHAQSVVLMHRAIENVRKKLQKTKDDLLVRLETAHPVKSRIQPWIRDELRRAEAEFIDECQWSAHEEALLLCSSHHLAQTVYFLNRDLTFMKEREPVLLMELKKVKTPTRSFRWLTQIWLPRHWVVKRIFQGATELIPTILSSTPTSITTPRSDPSQPVFLVEKEIVRVTTTRWPMWRWINYCHRTWAWTWNAMFLFGVIVPWCSPVSFRALLSIEPFLPDLELSQLNGTLFPRKSSQTPTLCSRLKSLWRHISKSRTHFETKPDTGFIGKGMTRHIDRVWNYIIKGLLGTLLWVVLFPLLCLTVCCVSIVIAMSAVFWMPVVTFILHLAMGLVCDLDSPDPERNSYLVILEALIWNILIQGCLQPIAALFVAAIVCPLVSLAILGVGVTRYGARLAWDALMFHAVIKPRGRVPASDSIAVKRVAGPGLAQDYWYHIRPEQALAALEARMELDELAAYQHEMEQVILQPQRDFSEFVECCFTPFSASLSKTGVYAMLEKEGQDLLNCLHEKLEKRRRELQLALTSNIRSKIKLPTTQLKIALQQGAIMLERFYPTHVLERLPATEEEFWESRGLAINDWSGLTAMIYADIFCLDFLTPLDDIDTKFNLEPHAAVDLSRFAAMVAGAELGEGPDLLSPVHAPRGNIQVQSPFLDISSFNPRPVLRKNEHKSDSGSTHYNTRLRKRTTWSILPGNVNSVGWTPWKREGAVYSAEKLVIPLPIPHPVQIAIIIHNRDADDPIPLHSDDGIAIIKAMEDCQGSGLGKYRDGEEESTDSRESSVSLAALEEPTCPPMELRLRTGTEWTISRQRNNSESVHVDLASPEDISLDTESTRVVFCQYGTTV